MKHRDYDELRSLLERFQDPSKADSTEREIRAGGRFLDMYPAPDVAPELLADIKRHVVTQLGTSRGPSRPLYRYVGAVAAVIVVALIGLFGRPARESSDVSYASLIPAAIWESDDIASDDMELAYFRSELRQIETQMQALEAGDGDVVATASLDDVEMEMIRIDMQFWKE